MKPGTVRPLSTPVLPARCRESGITLIFTLGFLSVMLVMMLSLALLSRGERRAAALNTGSVRARLAAETAMARALAELRVACEGQVFPADTFITPSPGSAWAGQYLLASRDPSNNRGDLKAGLAEAVATSIAGRELAPAAKPAAQATWIPVLGTVTESDGTTSEAIIGRYNYVVIDQTGRIDPAAVVRPDQSEGSGDAVRLGYALTDISLGDLGFADPDRFNYADADYPGQLPSVGRWFSLAHMIRGMGFSQDEVDLAARTLHPFSYDTETFWRDRNDNGAWDAGEDTHRVNIVAATDPRVIYQAFVGPMQDFTATENGLHAGADDCAWLKQLDESAWFCAWRDRVFAEYSEPERTNRARATVAAQVALNIADYTDADSIPTQGYVGTDGQLHLGTSSTFTTLHGVENNWGISEVGMRVQVDVVGSFDANDDGGGGVDDNSQTDIDFTIVSGEVIPSETYEASVTILGIGLGVYNISTNPPTFISWCGVTAELEVGDEILEPWGDYTNCYTSNLNDGNNPRNFDIPGTFPPGTPISVRSRYYYHPHSYDSRTRTYNVSTSWTHFESLTSTGNSDRVLTLRDGDSLPSFSTVFNQNDIAYYVEDYIVDGRVRLQPNQAIFLFETNRASSSAGQDFQDLVVLVTMRPVEPEPEPNIITEFAVQGLANINPTNNGVDSFTLTKPDGSQITRADLHNWGQDYTGPANAVHIRPKGNANQNTFALNGQVYAMRNNTSYDFTGPMQVRVYNDRRGSNGRAMGQWWIGVAGEGISIVEGGERQLYVEVEEPEPGAGEDGGTVSEPVPLGEDPVAGSTGNHLRVRVGFQTELFYPFAEDYHLAFAPQGVTVQYTLQLSTTTGKNLTYTGTVDLVPTEVANADGGTLLWTPEYANGEWLHIADAFAQDQNPPVDTYTITMARIDSIVLRDRLGDVVNQVPPAGTTFCTWGPVYSSATDQNFFVGAAAYDPLMNSRGQTAADFDLFWDVRPADYTMATESSSEVNGIGGIAAGYNSSPYSGIGVKNAPIERLGELGRVHSYQPSTSLRLWSASNADTAGHDAAILDLFKVGNDIQTRGKININTLQREVLVALFRDCTTVSPEQAADAVLAYRESNGPFTNIGQVFGAVSGLSGTNTAQDAAEEATVSALAEKLTVRQNYFLVLIHAQAVKDIGGIPYRGEDGQMTQASLGKFDVAYNSAGEMLRNVDRILAEEKMLAVVYRDAFSGKMRVEHVELLNE